MRRLPATWRPSRTPSACLRLLRALSGSLRRLDKQKPLATGGERAIGLVDRFTPELTDSCAALKHYRERQAAEGLKAWLLEQAEKDVRAGLPGDPRIYHPSRESCPLIGLYEGRNEQCRFTQQTRAAETTSSWFHRGMHPAVCDMMVDLGLQEQKSQLYGDSIKHQVYIRWQIPASAWNTKRTGRRSKAR
jgi:hypothetical protein